MEEKIQKVLKKPLLMEAPCPAQNQDEATEVTDSESKKSRDNTFQENTEHFFVTQVCACPVSVIFILLL